MINSISAARIFAGMEANSPAGSRKGIAFLYGQQGPGQIALPDLMDIHGNINFSGTFLSTGCQAIIRLIEMQQPVGHTHNGNNTSWTNLNTAPASFAFIRVHMG